jgi:GR25 family glycosyltransferase involved in LPS biosynthesis
MNINQELPLRFWINLGRRQDRRDAMEASLAQADLVAERLPAVDAQCMRAKVWNVSQPQTTLGTRSSLAQHSISVAGPPTLQQMGRYRGYESAGRYALALTQRLAIREAARRKAPAVLLLEDDAVFHPNFQALMRTVELPVDWGILYLGCSHRIRPTWAGSRVVKTKFAVDTHAVAVKAAYYRTVMNMLDRHGKENPGVPAASDQFLALLHKTIPTYACFPNLVWQESSASDLLGVQYSNYNRDGQQRNYPETISGLLTEIGGDDEVPQHPNHSGLLTARSHPNIENIISPNPKLGLLFLTRGDVNHPDIWREFVETAPLNVKVLSHSKTESEIGRGFLKGTAIKESFETKWGDISLVRATRALILTALTDPSLTHFALLSESCIPILPLPEMLRRLALDPRPQFDFCDLDSAKPQHAERIHAVPQVPPGCWRFTAQWWLMDRVAANFASAEDFTPIFEKMFVPDEAYFPTVMTMQGYPLTDNVIKKRNTWTCWEEKAGSPTEWKDFPVGKLPELIHSGCMFARKFPIGANIGRLGLHLPPIYHEGHRVPRR